MKTWIGWLAVVLNLDENGVSPCILPKTDERLLLTKRGAAAQAEQDSFVVKGGESLRYLFTTTVEVIAYLYVTPELHLYVHYTGVRKKLLREAFLMEEVEILPNSVFVGHGYVHHAGSEWSEDHCIQYYGYLNPKNHNLADAIAFLCKHRNALGSKKPAVSLKGGLDQQGSE